MKKALIFVLILIPISLKSGGVCLMGGNFNSCHVIGFQDFGTGYPGYCGFPMGEPRVEHRSTCEWIDCCFNWQTANNGSYRLDYGHYGANVQWYWSVTWNGMYQAFFNLQKIVGCGYSIEPC
jgi:hypothetical protein